MRNFINFIFVTLLLSSCVGKKEDKKAQFAAINKSEDSIQSFKTDSVYQQMFTQQFSYQKDTNIVYNIELYNGCFAKCFQSLYFYNLKIDTIKKSINADLYGFTIGHKLRGLKVRKKEKCTFIVNRDYDEYTYHPINVNLQDTFLINFLNKKIETHKKNTNKYTGYESALRVYVKKPDGTIIYHNFSDNLTDNDPIILEFCKRLKKMYLSDDLRY